MKVVILAGRLPTPMVPYHFDLANEKATIPTKDYGDWTVH